MTTSDNLIKWEYQLTYHVPISLDDNGNIEWAEQSDHCVITLPASIENPCEFLGKSGYDNQVDIIDFTDFSKVDA